MADKDLIETPVSGELTYEGLFLKVQLDQARLPDQSIAGREFVVHPGAAAMVPVFDDGRILVERQYRYSVKKVLTEIPAGKIDPGETSLQTAKRELVEETGYEAARWGLLTSIHPAAGFADETVDIFLCRELTQVRQQLDPGEFLELEVVTLGWLVDELKAGRLPDVKTQLATLWLENLFSGRWDWPKLDR